MSSIRSSHKDLLTRLTIFLHFTVAAILFLSPSLSTFDSSASLVFENRWLASLLRWDVFHYSHIARNRYVYEYEYAFFPGAPKVMEIGAKLLLTAGVSERNIFAVELLAGALASSAIAVDATHTLYDLTMCHLHNPHAALLVSLLSLLSSSPATLRFAPYAEPFFVYLSYKGMLQCARRRFVRASVWFAIASFFRSNGTMLAGYIVWGMGIEPVLSSARLSTAIGPKRLLLNAVWCFVLSTLPIMPFLWHQYNGYRQFCDVLASERRRWCANRLPLIYSFVQSEYWDVGLFRYWTLQQAPNILLASPVLVLLLYGSISHIRRSLLPRLHVLLQGRVASAVEFSPDPFLDPSITPHAIHALVLSAVLLTSAHTQIALRLAGALPFTYWTAASLFFPKERFKNVGSDIDHGRRPEQVSQTETKTETLYSCVAQWWVGWSMFWGMISLVTWGVFLPPA